MVEAVLRPALGREQMGRAFQIILDGLQQGGAQHPRLGPRLSLMMGVTVAYALARLCRPQRAADCVRDERRVKGRRNEYVRAGRVRPAQVR